MITVWVAAKKEDYFDEQVFTNPSTSARMGKQLRSIVDHYRRTEASDRWQAFSGSDLGALAGRLLSANRTATNGTWAEHGMVSRRCRSHRIRGGAGRQL